MIRDKALQILFNTYWSGTGWKREFTVSPEDFAYAKNAGYMFASRELSHDDVVVWLRKSFTKVNFINVSNAFLASLSTRRLELRSALGSYAIAKNFPDHVYSSAEYCCSICGVFRNTYQPYDLNELNFERFKWGGVRHERPEYIAFDLEQFNQLESVTPINKDIDIMRQIIETTRTCGPKSRPRDLEKRLAGIFRSNKAEREILIEILAYCGILQPHDHLGYYRSFVNYFERTIPPVAKIDWTYPICWWRGVDGINKELLQSYFPIPSPIKG